MFQRVIGRMSAQEIGAGAADDASSFTAFASVMQKIMGEGGEPMITMFRLSDLVLIDAIVLKVQMR